ncbi:Rap1a/Tai family immunity protein [Pseudomonas rhodesiae]|jgi:hypothetical protein|uniref:Rap1a/Tai family immunity protein n=1 Tax=Pseudomonas rhodesiae TaxID=76760 RepID=UPI0028D433F0|nr:Rap1a/Tai family immunity protein [Pseudomonas rhodesiae]
MKTLRAVMLGALLATPTIAWSMTGNDLVKWMPDYESNSGSFGGGVFGGYVAGIADFTRGVLFCPAGNITNGQNAAIVVKFLKNNPEKWNQQASGLVIEALSRAYPKCPGLQQK